MTHSVKFLPQCDIIVVLRDGCVSEVGGFKDLLLDDGDFAGFLRQYMTESDLNDMDLEVEESTKSEMTKLFTIFSFLFLPFFLSFFLYCSIP